MRMLLFCAAAITNRLWLWILCRGRAESIK